MIWFFYNLLFPLGFLILLPKFLSRMMRRGGYRKHFEQRFGFYGKGTTARLAEVRRIWVHAVSVGEIQIALRLMEAVRLANPEARFVLSTATSTAHALAKNALNSDDVLIYFPIDLPGVMKRTFNAIHPLKLILVECEFWPNLIRQAHRRKVPIALMNGRISDSSFRGYMRVRPLTRSLLERIDSFCVQSRQDADRIMAMGARPASVHTLGTAKYDLLPPASNVATVARFIFQKMGVPEPAKILLGGSTWPGEEEALCAIYRTLKADHPELFLVLVPRHAERREEVQQLIGEQGLSCTLLSQLRDSFSEDVVFRGSNEMRGTVLGTSSVLLVDTTGELMNFYAVSDVVFVGKSLYEHGGQNPIEPALFGKAIIVGPNMENFGSVMDDFKGKEALYQVQDISELEEKIEKLLVDSTARTQLGRAAQQVVESHRGVIDKMVREIP